MNFKISKIGVDKTTALLTVLVLTIALLWSRIGVAQNQAESITLGISPTQLDLTANPGEKITNTLRLTNASDAPVDIETIAENFVPSGEEGAVDITEDRTTFALAEWITVSPDKATLQSKATQDFEVSISVPSNAEPGSHFGTVVFRTIPPEDQSAQALVSQEIAPVILVKIAGDVRESSEIESFKSDKQLWSNESSINLTARVKNTGSTHFKPTGQIVIKNMFGKKVATLELPKQNVLPDSIRALTTTWQKPKYSIGRYTAELTVVSGENNEIRTAKTSFYIIPYQTIMPILIILTVVGYILFKARKRLVLAFRVLSGKDNEKK